MKLFLSAAVAALLAMPAFAADTISIVDPYIRALGAGSTTGAAFFIIENDSDQPDRLVSVRTEVAERAELHTHKKDANGMMMMVEVPEGFAVEGNADHALARGGDHVMLMGLKRDLTEGEMVTLVLTFEHSGEVVVDIPVDNQHK
jgi:copper(I)-binding protein